MFGKRFEPFGHLTVPPGAILDVHGTELVDVEGETLAIAPESASWAFLNRSEAAAFAACDGAPFGRLAASWPDDAPAPAEAFVAHLYRRGLLGIAGMRAVDSRMFADGPNYDEGNLVELLLTEKCNLACPYCLAGANQSMPAMDEAIGRRTVDLAFAMNEAHTLAFEFAGGEPMLKFPLMQRLVDYIDRHPARGTRRVFLSLQTNATLLNEERVRWLAQSSIRVGISIEGDQATQDRGRPQVNGKGSFAALMRGIDLLKRHQVPFGALVVLNRGNIGDPEGLARFLLSHQIHGFRINPVAYLGDARRNWAAVGLDQLEIVDYFRRLMAAIVSNRLLLLEDNIHSMCMFLTSKQRRTRCMRAACGAGDTFQSISGNGDIYPCGRATQTPVLKLGNIFDRDLASLSAPARDNPMIGELRARRPEDFDTCRVCHYRQLCQAGCAAQALERYGTLRHKTPECDFYKTLYPELMRWLSFDADAFAHLEATSYFEREGARFDRDFLPAAPPR
jgi:radical SAM protein with 4Fe4S-binding SPASM domain